MSTYDPKQPGKELIGSKSAPKKDEHATKPANEQHGRPPARQQDNKR